MVAEYFFAYYTYNLACIKATHYNGRTSGNLSFLQKITHLHVPISILYMRKTKAEAMKTREYLMLAALDTFYLRGVARASLNEIAQTAGVTRGALYWHFKNKEDLFDALFQHIFNDFSTKMAEDIANGNPDMWVNLRHALINLYERMQNNEIHCKFVHILHLKCEHTEQNQAIIDVMTRYQRMWHEQIHAALLLCIQQQTLPESLDVDLAGVYLISTLTGLCEIWLNNPEQFNINEIAPPIVDTAMGALQRCPSLRTGS